MMFMVVRAGVMCRDKEREKLVRKHDAESKNLCPNPRDVIQSDPFPVIHSEDFTVLGLCWCWSHIKELNFN